MRAEEQHDRHAYAPAQYVVRAGEEEEEDARAARGDLDEEDLPLELTERPVARVELDVQVRGGDEEERGEPGLEQDQPLRAWSQVGTLLDSFTRLYADRLLGCIRRACAWYDPS